MIKPTIPSPLRAVVDRELESGERIEWMGMPRRSIFSPVLVGAILSGSIFTTIGLLWMAAAIWGVMNMNGGPGLFIVFPLIGVPFVLIGFCMIGAPFWVVSCARRTVYVITDRRAISVEGGWSTTIRSHPAEKLTDVFRHERADGSGDVIFSRQTSHAFGEERRSEILGFWRIVDSKEVEQRLKNLAERSEELQMKRKS